VLELFGFVFIGAVSNVRPGVDVGAVPDARLELRRAKKMQNELGGLEMLLLKNRILLFENKILLLGGKT